MNIFIVSHLSPKTERQELIRQLSRIRCEPQKTVQVVAVDDRFNLAELPVRDRSTGVASFKLDDFFYEMGSTPDGVMRVDQNRIAQRMDAIHSHWVLIDFGQNDPNACADFILKLSRYSYMTPTLRDRNLVFSVPTIYLGTFARALNESFNNLPSNNSAFAQSGQVGMLFVSTSFEKIFTSLPLFSGVLIRLSRLAMYLYRRFMRAV